MEKQREIKHSLMLGERSKAQVSGVQQVGSFDEEEVILETKMGVLVIKGEGLHITQLNLEEGNLMVEGYVNAITYSDDKGVKGFKSRGKGILERMLR